MGMDAMAAASRWAVLGAAWLAIVPGPAGAAAEGPRTIRIPSQVATAEPAPSPVATPAPTPAPERGSLSVMVDRAKVIRLPERTNTVVVGNPSIADLAVQKNGIVVVTGKSYGVTNLIALDAAGAMLAESIVSVGAPSDGLLTVQRGMERQTYTCNPTCQPSILLGDGNTFFSENRTQAEQRNLFATGR